MKKVVWYILWIFFYLLCGFLGLIVPETGLQKAAMTVLGLAFFVPPAVLLVQAHLQSDKKELLRLRLISILSLSLTLVVFFFNIISVGGTEAAGNVLYYVLIFVSVPMICCRFYVLSLFLWACLLFASIPAIYRKKK